MAIIAVLVIALQKVSSKKTIMVGTSSWPGWDLFEHAQKKGDPLANYNLKFTRFNEYNDILNAFINNTIDMATVTLHEALVIQSKIKDPVRIILLLDYTIGSDAILAHSTTEFLHQLKGKTVGTEKNTVAYYTLLRGLEKRIYPKKTSSLKIYLWMNYSHNSNKKNWTPLACMTPTFLNSPALQKMYQHYFLPKKSHAKFAMLSSCGNPYQATSPDHCFKCS